MAEKKCPKCGRNAAENQAFCQECLAEMEKYPVKPGVVVLLPRREQQMPKTAAYRRHSAITPEEQIQKLKKRITALTLALLIALGAAGGLGWLALQEYLEGKNVVLLPGQNYSSDTPSYLDEIN